MLQQKNSGAHEYILYATIFERQNLAAYIAKCYMVKFGEGNWEAIKQSFIIQLFVPFSFIQCAHITYSKISYFGI